MRKTDLSGATCPVARSLGEIGDWWSLLIVRDAMNGVSRFGDFQRSLGCARNILSARLAKLVETGVMATGPASDGSPYREYRLTEKGKALRIVLTALRQWGEGYLFDDEEERVQLVDIRDGEPVAPLEMRAHDGRVLSVDDVEIQTTSGAA
ncbi:HxlR family transcriptional regulator [Streptomyces sulfonofaciens]|uniref:HxlR family transcriptional regulator n=1 Tax=Streptomyces sulfonofaciens TaxID=68272 RepID=A0A919L849_9ACTN|nr:helix-turn-helix domain-containing protein [Streptomyces sulfonofaciens]GHH86201.1 HxlR family transcriptional regulator [Streptomyces sulfonofaciens]